MLLFGRKRKFYEECVSVAKSLSGLPKQAEQLCKVNQGLLLELLAKDPNITPRGAIIDMADIEFSWVSSMWGELSSSGDGPTLQLNRMLRDNIPIWVKMLVVFRIGEAALESDFKDELPISFEYSFLEFRKVPLPTKSRGLVPIEEWVNLPDSESFAGLI